MTEPTSNNSRKITLEELLRLKRHERPGPEYWARFDRELNEKVWRALANPPEARAGFLPALLGRKMRWMAVGVVSALGLMLAWPTGTTVPTVVQLAASHNLSISPVAASPVATPSNANVPVQVASAAPAPVEVAPTAETTFAVANLAPSTSPAGYDKIPATLSLPAAQISGERFASAGFGSPAYSARWGGSAAY